LSLAIEEVNSILVNAGIDLDRISYNHSICLGALFLFLKLINHSEYETYRKKCIDYAVTIARKKMNFESEQDATTQDIFERMYNDCEHGEDYLIKDETLYLYRTATDDKIKYQPYFITNSITPYRLKSSDKYSKDDIIYFPKHSERSMKKVQRRCHRFSISEIYRKFGIDFRDKQSN
jgi:hypothetical protein